jgi:hypothetical protein
VVTRGVCSFADKAREASARGAAAVVVVNTESGLFQLHGDDQALDEFKASSIAVVLVSPRSGLLLQQHTNTCKTLGRPAVGSLVGLTQTSFVDEWAVEQCGECTSSAKQTDMFPSEEAAALNGGILRLIRDEPAVANTAGRGVDAGESDQGVVVGVGRGGDNKFEFVAAEFGAPLVLDTPMDLVLANPADG